LSRLVGQRAVDTAYQPASTHRATPRFTGRPGPSPLPRGTTAGAGEHVAVGGESLPEHTARAAGPVEQHRHVGGGEVGVEFLVIDVPIAQDDPGATRRPGSPHRLGDPGRRGAGQEEQSGDASARPRLDELEHALAPRQRPQHSEDPLAHREAEVMSGTCRVHRDGAETDRIVDDADSCQPEGEPIRRPGRKEGENAEPPPPPQLERAGEQQLACIHRGASRTVPPVHPHQDDGDCRNPHLRKQQRKQRGLCIRHDDGAVGVRPGSGECLGEPAAEPSGRAFNHFRRHPARSQVAIELHGGQPVAGRHEDASTRCGVAEKSHEPEAVAGGPRLEDAHNGEPVQRSLPVTGRSTESFCH
jgi:hypothetical protein